MEITVWKRIRATLVLGTTLLALTTAAACTPETSNGSPQQTIPQQRTGESCPVSFAGPPVPPPADFIPVVHEVHLYDTRHADPGELGDEVMGLRNVSITVDGVGPNGDKAYVTFDNPETGVPGRAPVTYTACPPSHDQQNIKVGMVAVSWTTTIDVLTEGYTMSCLVRNALPPQVPISANRITATGGKILGATVTCVWP